MQGFVGFLRETLAHYGIIEHIDTEIFIDKRHRNPTFQSLDLFSLEEISMGVKWRIQYSDMKFKNVTQFLINM